MEIDWAVTPLDGRDDVTLVTVELRNSSSVARRVRVTNRLDDRVLPPRRGGVPEAGWDEEGFEGVVAANGRRVLGYACSASARRPPVSVVDEGRASETADGATTATVLRELGDARPPADALPAGNGAMEGPDGGVTGRDGAETDGVPNAIETGDTPNTVETGDVPDAVEAWLDAVADRIERGERLTDASVKATTAALESEENAIGTLEERIASDVEALATVERRVSALAERGDAVDVPVEALRRLS